MHEKLTEVKVESNVLPYFGQTQGCKKAGYFLETVYRNYRPYLILKRNIFLTISRTILFCSESVIFKFT